MRAGRILTAEDFATISDPPRCTLRRAASQTIAGSGVLEWDTVDSDDWGFWSAGSPTLIVPNVGGRYLLTISVGWANKSDTSRRIVATRLNGSSLPGGSDHRNAINGNSMVQPVATMVVVDGSSDEIDVNLTEGATGDIAITASLDMVWIAPA